MDTTRRRLLVLSDLRRWGLAVLAALTLISGAGATEHPSMMRPAATRYTTADLVRGFMLTVFGREGPRQSSGDVVNKFTDRIRVSLLDRSGLPGRSAEVSEFVQLLAKVAPNLRIGLASPDHANVFVFIVDRADYRKVIAEALPNNAETRFLKGNRCSAIMWNDTPGVLRQAYVFIVANQGDAAFRSCLAEELTQALGPANDNDSLADSLYNDSNDVGTFGLYDWFILSALYDESVVAGMKPSEALAVAPAAMERLRAKAGSVDIILRVAAAAPPPR